MLRQPVAPDPFVLSRSFAGIDGTSREQSFPDSSIAAGPENLVFATNEYIAIMTKAGALVSSIPSSSFFDPVKPPNEHPVDPFVLFDPGSQRFFLVASTTTGPCDHALCAGYYLLAISKSSRPTRLGSQDWFLHAWDRAPLGDYDKLAASDRFLVIAGDSEQRIQVIDKAKLISGEPVTSWVELNIPARSLAAIGSGGEGPFFLVQQTLRNCDFTIYALDGLPFAPTLDFRPVRAAPDAECSPPPTASQPPGRRRGVPFVSVPPVYSQGSIFVTPPCCEGLRQRRGRGHSVGRDRRARLA